MPDAHQAFHPSEVGKLYQLWLGARSSSHGHEVVSVELLLGPFHSSFCSWSVVIKRALVISDVRFAINLRVFEREVVMYSYVLTSLHGC